MNAGCRVEEIGGKSYPRSRHGKKLGIEFINGVHVMLLNFWAIL